MQLRASVLYFVLGFFLGRSYLKVVLNLGSSSVWEGSGTAVKKAEYTDIVNETTTSLPTSDTAIATTATTPTTESTPAQPLPVFRILCTAPAQVMRWGSFRIRCQDFKHIAESLYGPQLQIDAVALNNAKGHYNSSIIVKGIFPLLKIASESNGTLSFGNIFIDVVDDHGLNNQRVSYLFHVIVQNELQAKEVFGKRSPEKVHIVPHWFNSFAADMESELPVWPAPALRPTWQDGQDPLRLALIWDPRPNEKALAQKMISIPDSGYQFLELSYGFDIETWFEKYNGSPTVRNALGQNESIAEIIKDPERGGPYLYQLLFRKFDALLVLGKTSQTKARYNSIQRATSQMRSGIPVLLECVPAHAKLCEVYPCSFHNSSEMKDVLERMKSAELRAECSRKGIEITSK